jgi:hypothetical protein
MLTAPARDLTQVGPEKTIEISTFAENTISLPCLACGPRRPYEAILSLLPPTTTFLLLCHLGSGVVNHNHNQDQNQTVELGFSRNWPRRDAYARQLRKKFVDYDRNRRTTKNGWRNMRTG